MPSTRATTILPRRHLGALLEALRDEGYDTIGPTVRDAAIVLARVTTDADLPIGWGDEQAPGRYRLRPRGDAAVFGHAAGPHSWKSILFPAEARLWRASRTTEGLFIDDAPPPAAKLALLGVRACDLAAIAIQDRVLLGGAYPDPIYRARREGALIIAVACGTAAATCFCTSMLEDGPRPTRGFDLSLTERLAPQHAFVVEVATEKGAAALAALERRVGPLAPATDDDRRAAEAVCAATAESITRRLDRPAEVPQALKGALEHPRWDDVAARCLTCGNCTMACPTCFCTQVTDTTDLTGDHAERWRRWDSCFGLDHSYMHGGSVRPTARSRYRQWLTHKLSTWHDQFGASGCTGCGRCVAWCPVGIDITDEVRALLADRRAP